MTEPFDPSFDDEPLDPVEELMADVLMQPAGDRSAHLEALCSEHPDLASDLRQRFDGLAAMGLDTLKGADGGRGVPERLGEFRLLETLGGGGMGVVYRAVQEPLGREVALKLIRPEQLYFPHARERFRREIEAVARLQHPGIVPVYTVGEQDGIPYFAMELVPGLTLAQVLHALAGRAPESLRGADLLAVLDADAGDDAEPVADVERRERLAAASWSDACVLIARQVAEALSHAHERDVIHRDIKPSNIVVTRDGRALLLDFGLTASGAERRAGEHAMTRTGSQLGTPAYMSPEQVRGQRVDARTDVYSLGATLYELLALAPPFEGGDDVQTQQRILDGDAPPLRQRHRRLAPELDVVVGCALALEPSNRYASAAALANDLDAVLQRRPIAARAPGPLLAARRWAQRHRARATALALGALLVLGIPTALLIQEMRFAEDLQAQRDELARSLANETAAREAEARARADETLARADAERQRDRADEARTDAEQQRDAADAARTEAVTERDRADEARADAETQRDLAVRQAENADAALAFLRGLLVRAAPDVTLGRPPTLDAVIEQGAADLLASTDTRAPDMQARLHLLIGQLLESFGRLQDARAILDRGLAFIPEDADPTLATVRAQALVSLGSALARQSLWDAADATLRAALDALPPFEQARNLVSRARTMRAYCLSNTGRIDDAERILVELWQAWEQVPPELDDEGWLPTILNDLADVAGSFRLRWSDALQLQERALQLMRARVDAPHPDLVHPLANLGKYKLNTGDLLGAEDALLQAQLMADELWPGDTDREAFALLGLSRVWHVRGEFERAAQTQLAAHAMYTRLAGPLHEHALTARDDLAITLRNLPGWREAYRGVLVDTLERQKQVWGADTMQVARWTNEIAWTTMQLGWHERAGCWVEDAAERLDRHDAVRAEGLDVLVEYAEWHLDQGERLLARQLLDRAEAMLQRTPGAPGDITARLRAARLRSARE